MVGCANDDLTYLALCLSLGKVRSPNMMDVKPQTQDIYDGKPFQGPDADHTHTKLLEAYTLSKPADAVGQRSFSDKLLQPMQFTDSLHEVTKKPAEVGKSASELAKEFSQALADQKNGDANAFGAFRKDLEQAMRESPGAAAQLASEITKQLPDGYGLILTSKDGGYDDFTHRTVHIVRQLGPSEAGKATYESEKYGPCADLTKPLELSYAPEWMKRLGRQPQERELGTDPKWTKPLLQKPKERELGSLEPRSIEKLLGPMTVYE